MPVQYEPALTDAEWETLRNNPLSAELVAAAFVDRWKLAPDRIPKIMAALNDNLPISEPRKIARAWVNEILFAAGEVASSALVAKGDERRLQLLDNANRLRSIAAALNAYLPPLPLESKGRRG